MAAQPRASLHLEGSLGLLLSGPVPGAADFGPSLDLSARVGVDLRGPLSAQLSGAHRHFFSPDRDAPLNLVTLGLRLSPRLGSVGRGFVDLNLGPAVTVRQAAVFLAADVGAGFEFALTRSLHLGPMVRYSRLFASPRGFPDDAQSVTFGVSFSYYTPDRAARAESMVPIIPEPPPDHDFDSVPDPVDQAPDRDHDTVPDPVDACPDVPGAASEIPPRNGCPVGGISLPVNDIRVAQVVFFDSGVAEPRRGSESVLGDTAAVLRATPTIRRVEVAGHTDDRLPAARALALSQRRAELVVRRLTALGVEAARLTAVGYGAARPRGRNYTRDERARHNRVEFVVVDPPAPPDRPMCPFIVRGDRDPLAAAFDAGPPDRDRDRVPDEQDHCPDVPVGAHPDAACVGCPEWPLTP